MSRRLSMPGQCCDVPGVNPLDGRCANCGGEMGFAKWRDTPTGLDTVLGLHTRLEVHFVVDGFIAQLYDEPREACVQAAFGPTVKDALARLADRLAGLTESDARGLPEVTGLEAKWPSK